jgi:hypothetical protein
LEAGAAFRAKVGVAISVTSARAVMSAFMMPLQDYGPSIPGTAESTAGIAGFM